MNAVLGARALQDPARSATRRSWCGPTPRARTPTADPGCSRRRRARWRSTTPPTSSASTPPSSGAATCCRRPISRSPRRRPTCSKRSRRSRPSSRRSRSSSTRRSAPSRPPRGRRAATSASASAPTWSRPRWPEPTLHDRGRDGSRRGERQGGRVSWARRRTARAWRPRWPRSSPSTSVWRTTTSRSCRRDTQSTPYGPGTGGSRTAVIAGGAARARRRSRCARRCSHVAAHAMEASPDDLEIADGAVSVRGTPSWSITLREVAKLAYRTPDQLPPEVGSGLEATVRFRPTQFPTWSNATPHLRGRDRPRDVPAARAALHRLRGLRADDQPDGRRGPDRRRRGAGHRRACCSKTSCTTPTATRSRRRSWTTCCRRRARCPTIEIGPHRDRVDNEPGWVQGHGRGRRDRLRTPLWPTRSPTRSVDSA